MNTSKMKNVAKVLIVIAIVLVIVAIVFFYHAYGAYDQANGLKNLMGHSYDFGTALGYASRSADALERGKKYLAGGIITSCLALGAFIYSLILTKRVKSSE